MNLMFSAAMVTYKQFCNYVRSYHYRIRLLNSIDEIEHNIIDYMNNINLGKMSIPDYYIDITEDRIIIVEREYENQNQLDIDFENVDEKKRQKQE